MFDKIARCRKTPKKDNLSLFFASVILYAELSNVYKYKISCGFWEYNYNVNMIILRLQTCDTCIHSTWSLQDAESSIGPSKDEFLCCDVLTFLRLCWFEQIITIH